MSSNLLTLTKWFPLSIVDYEATFVECKQLRMDCFKLIGDLVKVIEVLNEVQHININFSSVIDKKDALPVQDMDKISIELDNIEKKFTKCFHNIQVSKGHVLLLKKFKLFKQLLRKTKLQLCYILQEFICDIAYLFVSYGNDMLNVTLKLSTLYNKLLQMDIKFNLLKNSSSVCNNTCPYLLFPLRKFSVTRLLQILSYHRAECCCHKLIDCLLETYKMHENAEDDNSSDNSSLEIYMALTKHLSPPVEVNNSKKGKDCKANVDDSIGSFINLEELISYEETNVINLLNATQQVAPVMLGKEGIKKISTGEYKICGKVAQKALEYYEQILWAEVGNYLEHVILWWACSPLSARPPRSSQHLREWINHFVPTAEVPPVILSALTSLADALGVHVTSTLWDQCFRQALVASKTTCNPETGPLFSNLLLELVALCNLCEITPDWIIGAPLDELPLVEQIPVLHRLDHSIHTARLWALNDSRKIANNWNVEAFFSITHTDIMNCLSQLNDLRLTDHIIEIEKGGMAVHVEVCALMRAKLVSEVKVNMLKLKNTPNECVSCLASICKVINLANLQMMFPPKPLWKINREDVPDSANSYVEKYLDKMLSPVLKSVDNDTICNMILTLISESWLDHIYNKKIKFSQWGAFQLLCDFSYVSMWIKDCPYITDHMRKKLLKNEVLRRCEGVGRLLLRCPGERLKMVDKKMNKKTEESEEDNQHQQMPAEMYVPNQEQWLELRALKRQTTFNPFCC